MKPQFFAIIDDREPIPAKLERLIGDIHFGDLLRRRRRYLDELVAAAAGADGVTILRNDEEAEALMRRIEAARGETLWLRLPSVIGPLQMDSLGATISKVRYALKPLFLGPILEDDAPAALFAADAIRLLSAKTGQDRRSMLLELSDTADKISQHELEFIDLRRPDDLRRFLSGATEPRAFNSLTVDHGVFVKSSRDIDKMRAEHGFFELATPELRRFLIPTFGYEEKDGIASYKMEHLRVPDAALQFVLGTFSEADFLDLLDQFFAFIATRERNNVGERAVYEAGQVQIVKKLHDRLETFLASDIGARVDRYLVAGGIADGLSGLCRRAAPFLETTLASKAHDYLAFSHGDPCLSNILFDRRIGLMRLIDPRGATRHEDAFMHPLYDLAKFSHSICGGYDFVNNGLFSIDVGSGLKLELRRHRGGSPDWMKRHFQDRLAAEGWVYRDVRAVEASLFLSMLPLHLDHDRKLLGFALIAQDIIEELEGMT